MHVPLSHKTPLVQLEAVLIRRCLKLWSLDVDFYQFQWPWPIFKVTEEFGKGKKKKEKKEPASSVQLVGWA